MSTVSSAFPPSDSWVAAVHASEVDHRPLGAAIVLDARRVLTCAHVVLTGADEPQEEIWISFPKIADAAGDERRQVISVDLANESPVQDLAVLSLDQDVPAGVEPAPLRCPRPHDLIERRWWAFGFPDRDPIGDTAEGIVGAALTQGWLRLSTNPGYLIKEGFSGTGLWSPDYEAIVAIVAAHSQGDGRAITMRQADILFPEQKLHLLDKWSVSSAGEAALSAWGWSLSTDPEGRRHWRPRSRGVSKDSERGYRFRGRTRALTEIASWLDRAAPDRKVLIVTGSPGAGKSAVLGRVVTTAERGIRAFVPADNTVMATPGSVACAVHAKDKTALDVATEIARAASATLPASPDDLASAVQEALQERDSRSGRFNVVIDALDEAANPIQARAIVTKIVLPLTEDCSDLGVQVVVGTRRNDDDGDLLQAFARAATVIDLDDPDYFTDTDLTAYALACLQLSGDERADNPYNDNATATPVASKIAELSDRNFLVAGIVARDHGLHDHTAIRAEELAFEGTVEAALTGYLERVSDAGQVPAMPALTALAFAETPGLPVSLWQTFIEALYDRRVPQRELAEFARSTAANFLVETGDDGATGPVFRLFHKALNDTLLGRRSRNHPRAEDNRALTRAMVRFGRDPDWESAPLYLLRSLSAHAAAAGLIDELLADETYLLYADLHRLVLEGGSAVSATATRCLRTIRLTSQAFSATGRERAALLSVTQALEYGEVTYDGRPDAPYAARWARAQPRGGRAVLEGHQSAVMALCQVAVDDRPMLASSSDDGTIRVWDPETGQQAAVLHGHQRSVRALCQVTVNGQPMLASAGRDRTIRIWDPATGQQTALLEGLRRSASVLCQVTVNDRPMLASLGRDGNIRVWDPAMGQQTALLEGHQRFVGALCQIRVNGQAMLAAASRDGTIWIWDPATSEQPAALPGHQDWVYWLCQVTLNGQAVLASASYDRTIRIWNPVASEQTTVPLGHRDWVCAICQITVSGQTMLATASRDGSIKIWDLAGGRPTTLIRGQQPIVSALCQVTVNDLTMLASGGDDGIISIWDATIGKQTAILKGHHNWIYALTQVTVNDKTMLASAGRDSTIRIWNPTTGEQTALLRGHSDWIYALTQVSVDDQTMLASASHEGTVRIWDPATGQRTGLLKGHRSSVSALCQVTINNRPKLALAGIDGAIRFWDPVSSQQPSLIEGHQSPVIALCQVIINGQTMLASGSEDRTARVWDPATGRQAALLEGHRDSVSALCQITVNGKITLASASRDRTVRIWDPATGRQVAVLQGHQGAVYAICQLTVSSQTLLASASDDRTIRIWDTASCDCVLTIPVHHEALALAWVDGALAIGLSAGILVVSLNAAGVR